MTTNTLSANDVTFLTALADYLLAHGIDRLADELYSVVGTPAAADAAQPADEWAEAFAR